MEDLPNPLIITLPGPEQLQMRFRLIPAGMARIGQRGGGSNEEPVCKVTIPQPFYLGETPVTQAQFAVWTGSEAYKAWFKQNRTRIRETSWVDEAESHQNRFENQPNHPAERVTWWEAQAFGEWLTEVIWARGKKAEIKPPWRAQLPSEAQWEYACRAGSDTEYWYGDGQAALAQIDWYDKNSGNETHPVAQPPNPAIQHPWGLHDLHGNVREWCLDAYDEDGYRTWVSGAVDHPQVPADVEGPDRVLRGGGWGDPAQFCRSASRFGVWPGSRFTDDGFRLAWVPRSGSSQV